MTENVLDVLNVLIHEMVHAVFEVWHCAGNECVIRRLTCHGSGLDGHGPEWVRVTNAITEVMALDNFRIPQLQQGRPSDLNWSITWEQEEARKEGLLDSFDIAYEEAAGKTSFPQGVLILEFFRLSRIFLYSF